MNKIKDPANPGLSGTSRIMPEIEPLAEIESITHTPGVNNDIVTQQEYRRHLATIVEFSDDAIISKSLGGIITSWNKGGEKMFGYTAKEAIGQHISLIIPPDNIYEDKKIVERIKRNETINHYETIRTKKNGEYVHVSLTVSPLKDATGTIIGISKIARDISYRKRLEQESDIANKKLALLNEEKEKRAAELLIANVELAFQNSEKEKRAKELQIANKELAFQNDEKEKRAGLLATVNQGLTSEYVAQLKMVADYKHALDESSILAITDENGIIKHVNENFCKVSRYTAEELIGQDHRMINSGFHPKEFFKEMWITISKGKIWRGEMKNQAKDGTTFWLDTTIVPFLNEAGKPYQYVALRADISSRKSAEDEIDLLHDDLERRVIERTEELESFSYSVSHDLRAPLRAVNGYARMLKARCESEFDEEGNRLINNIVDNATKMGQLIDDLLTFSRLGRREMTEMHISMAEIVTNLCAELQKDQTHRKIEFRIESLLPAKADNIGIKQVWLNLISNAIKYTRLKDHAIIEIGSEVKEKEIIYHIKDNGAGFDMRYVGKLFNIFQRLHSDDQFEGTGLGLAIVQRIIHKHGGRVWAEGKVDQEAVFYFSLNK